MTAELIETQPRPQVSLWTIFTSYFIVGLTAFGMAILQKLKALVMDNRWLSEEEMNDGLAMVQLYPGPLMVDFTAYVGYKLRGVWGATLATLGFILPSFFLMSVLSALYFAAGNLPWVKPLFVGVEALVVGVLFNVTLEMGGRNIQTRTQAVIMLLAFGALLLKLNAVLIVLVALALGAWLIRPSAGKNAGAGKQARAESDSLRRWLGIGAVAAVILAVVAFSWSLKSEIGGLALSLFKIGSLAFGNGSAHHPADSVRDGGRAWLDVAQPVCGWGRAGAGDAWPVPDYRHVHRLQTGGLLGRAAGDLRHFLAVVCDDAGLYRSLCPCPQLETCARCAGGCDGFLCGIAGGGAAATGRRGAEISSGVCAGGRGVCRRALVQSGYSVGLRRRADRVGRLAGAGIGLTRRAEFIPLTKGDINIALQNFLLRCIS
jgi:chromate transport protein ChrA